MLKVELAVLRWDTRFTASTGISELAASRWVVFAYRISFIAYSEIRKKSSIILTWRSASSWSACYTSITPVRIWISRVVVSSLSWAMAQQRLSWWKAWILPVRRNAPVPWHFMTLRCLCLERCVDFANNLHIGTVGVELMACVQTRVS